MLPPRRAIEAALVIPVPEAEALVGPYRLRFDPSAAAGVPAHITVNYPFRPHLSRPTFAQTVLSRLLSGFSPFMYTLAEVRTFPGVVYLAPTPSAPFIALIRAVAEAFPGSPPYEGQFPEAVPHLTVAQVEEDALVEVKTDFSQAARGILPIRARATEVWLMDNLQPQWKTRAVFPLKSPARTPPA